jgi:hypothetical protein
MTEKIIPPVTYSILLAAVLAFVLVFFIDCGGNITTDLDPNKPIFHNDADDYSYGAKYLFSLLLNLAWTPWIFLNHNDLKISEKEYGPILAVKVVVSIVSVLIALIIGAKLVGMAFFGGFIGIVLIAFVIGVFRQA